MSEQEFCIKLVNLVKKNECLYNYNLPDYIKRDVITETWTKVAEELNEDVVKCREKWRNLRAAFVKALNNPARQRGYYLKDELQFVIPYLKLSAIDNLPSPRSENNDRILEYLDTTNDFVEVETTSEAGPEETENEGNEENEVSNHVNTNIDYIEADAAVAEIPPLKTVFRESKQEKNEGERSASTSKEIQEESKVDESTVKYVHQLNIEMEIDAKKAFLASLLPDLDSLSDKEMRKFKRRVLSLIDEIIIDRQSDSE